MKECKITNFDLTYDGMYFLSWDNHMFRIYLELNTILKMLEIEGLTCEDVDKAITQGKPIHFNIVTMVVREIEIKGRLLLRNSDMSDNYFGVKNITMLDIELNQ